MFLFIPQPARTERHVSGGNARRAGCDLFVIWNLLFGAYPPGLPAIRTGPADQVIRPDFLLADNFGNIESYALNWRPPGANLL